MVLNAVAAAELAEGEEEDQNWEERGHSEGAEEELVVMAVGMAEAAMHTALAVSVQANGVSTGSAEHADVYTYCGIVGKACFCSLGT
jgi:hypothetical protein